MVEAYKFGLDQLVTQRATWKSATLQRTYLMVKSSEYIVMKHLSYKVTISPQSKFLGMKYENNKN